LPQNIRYSVGVNIRGTFTDIVRARMNARGTTGQKLLGALKSEVHDRLGSYKFPMI
jgi:hypothetical protein